MLMKKLLLSMFCAIFCFALFAQLSDDFSDYTVGGKLAQQAQAMGRDYWTTWSNAPGGAEDGVIGEKDGNKVYAPTFGVDQVLKLGNKTTGRWEIYLKIFIPAGKDGYFNIMNNFPIGTTNNDWSAQFCFACDVSGTTLYPGILRIYAAQSDPIIVNFTHDTWISMKIDINLDSDQAVAYMNDNQVHSWDYSLGSFGSGVVAKRIAALDIYPSSSTNQSVFYIDDIVFKEYEVPPVPSPIMDVTPLEFSTTVKEDDDNLMFQETVTIANTGDAQGTYELKVEGAEWLTIVGDATGTVAADATKTFEAVINATDLEPGAFNGKIVVTTNDAAHPKFEVMFTLTVLQGDTIPDAISTINDLQTIIYPNPASDMVTVESNVVINSIQIINNMGQIVLTTNVNENKVNLDVSKLSAGAYFLNVNTGKKSFSNKLIIK
jgi:hypothetical protein